MPPYYSTITLDSIPLAHIRSDYRELIIPFVASLRLDYQGKVRIIQGFDSELERMDVPPAVSTPTGHVRQFPERWHGQLSYESTPCNQRLRKTQKHKRRNRSPLSDPVTMDTVPTTTVASQNQENIELRKAMHEILENVRSTNKRVDTMALAFRGLERRLRDQEDHHVRTAMNDVKAAYETFQLAKANFGLKTKDIADMPSEDSNAE